MGKRIVVAGAGGFGRGVYAWLSQSTRHLEMNSVTDIVFIDDSFPSNQSLSSNVIGTIREYVPQNEDEVLVALGDPGMRKIIVDQLANRDARFHTFIDDRAIIAPDAEILTGAVICPGTVISSNVLVGEHVHINFNCSIGHDALIGAFTTLSPNVNIMGEVKVATGVFLGGSATVLPRLSISTRAVVGAAAVVVDSIDAGITVVGNPAKEYLSTIITDH